MSVGAWREPLATGIDERFAALHPASARLHARAAGLFPSGVTHDLRHFEPFPIVIDHAAGARKWDVDGNVILDYVMGHGALLFGHAHPALVEAVSAQVQRGTHYGASHTLEMTWAEAIRRLMPSVEKVRFTASGTEATMMAVRLARAATGREKLLRFRSHFHGWNDSVVLQARMSAGTLSGAGLPSAWQHAVTVVDQHDRPAMRAALESQQHAALILEPTGAGWGVCPLDPALPEFLREQTERTGTLLIFDEVITGFRVSPGGLQEAAGVRPDLTTLAKITAGGMPGGAVGGRAQYLDQIAFDGAAADRGARVAHPGTFNANPLSAAAGIAALHEVERGVATTQAATQALQLAQGLNALLQRHQVAGAVYGHTSMLHILLGHPAAPPEDGLHWNWGESGPQGDLPQTPPDLHWAFRRSLLNHGVDLMGMGAMVSAVHTDADIAATLEAMDATLGELRREGHV